MCGRRSSHSVLVLALSLLAVGLPAAFADPPSVERMLAADHLPGELIVKFRDETPEPAMRSLRVQFAARVATRFRTGAEHWLLGPGHGVEEALRTLIGHPLVAYAEPNYRVFPVRAPNDPRYPELWGLNNTGQQGGIPGTDIDAERAWDISTGDRRVRVAVIDTGIEASHPDLAAQIWTNPGEIPANGLDDDANGFLDDVHGWDFCDDDNDPADDDSHGTHVAGTIGGVANDGFGVAGVAWSVTIVPIKFLCYGWGSTADAIAAIEYATLLGVDVMNNSWGGGEYSQAMLDAINAAAQQEILFVAAAGNGSSDIDLSPFFPAGLDAPNIVAVAATDRFDGRAWFSNWGAQSVDLGAPGVDILSAVLGGGHGVKNGTSMATPHVSGVAALMRAIAPEMGVVALKQHLLESVDPVSSMSGITVTGGRLNAFQALSAVDDVAPAVVADLAVEATTSGSVSLVWTAPGDDADQGTARAYDLRYSTAPIDDDNFAAATPATAPTPQPAGSLERTEVGGLDAATLYHFALVSSDESGNVSPLSNVASGTTLDPPTIATSPPSFSASLITGAVSNQILTIENVGVGTLDWVIPPPDPGEPPPPGAAEELTLAKGQPDPRQGPAPASSGGPDPFGYRFSDSDEPDGPAFDWVDISATGTPIESLTGDDQSAGAIPIGFPFRFYDTPFEYVNVATNGFLSFTNSAAEFNNQPLPSSMAPEFLIAPFWDDLDFGGQVRASYLADGSSFTVQFTNVARLWGDGVYTFQVSLYPNGGIVFRYQSMVGRTDSATIGIQDGTQTQGLQVAFNAPYVHDGLAVRIDRTPDWLSATPSAGRLWSGERAEVAVTIDAAHLYGGHYDGVLTVQSNDPLRPAVPHVVSLDVTAAADIAVSPATLDFGEVLLGESRTLPLAVENAGTEPLQVTSIGSDRPEFVPDRTSLALSPFAQENVAVTFTPPEIGAFAGVLTLASDDPDEPVTIVRLSGVGTVPAQIEVAPPELDATLNQFAQETQSLTVSNTGGVSLSFTAEVVPRGPGLQRTSFTGLSAGDGRSDNPEPSEPGTAGAEPSTFRGEDASFEPLPASPVPLTCVAGDVAGRAVYAQANEGYRFFRFRTETGAWENLTDSPLHSGNNGGAALLGGTVYTSYTGTDTELGVYDIVTDNWTTRPHPLGSGTANVASDGARYLYFALSYRLVRYDPATLESVELAAPPFAFEPWGGLVHSDGRLYGHAGNGRSEFAVYDVANDTWRLLPPMPAGAVLGAAIDPLAQEYAAVGPFGGSNLYRFSLAEETWTVSTLPLFVNDGGLAWLPGRPSGLYVVQGEGGTQFTRRVGAPAWLRVVPDAGSVPSGSAAVLDVTFDSNPLLGGDFGATIEIHSNDPITPLVAVPADLTVIGVPDITLRGSERQLESAIDYAVDGALTQHALTIVVPPASDGSIELVADGDYGDSSELATATAEGLALGSVGATGSDCIAAAGQFPIGAADLLALAADGVVRVDVQNGSEVNVFCAANRHTVRLRYRGTAERLDFGTLFIGLSGTLEIEVRNGGSSLLEVSSITSDRPEFVPSAASLSLEPRASAILAITFTPGSAQSLDGTLTLVSNDPDEPLTTVAMHGEGLVPPAISVDPSSLAVDLFTGETTDRTLLIANDGGDLLRWTAEIEAADGGRVLSASPVFAGVEPHATPAKESLPAAGGRPPADQLYAANIAAPSGSADPGVAVSPHDPLEDVLLALDTRFEEIISLIPNRFDFSEGESGNSIGDGGGDMYDDGNFLSTDFGGYLPYSDGLVQASVLLGPAGRYFTRKHPGLFVLAADLDGVSEFSIEGNLGADGGGSVDGVVLETTVSGVSYRGFVKRVFNAGDPSVNHLIIVARDLDVDHEFSLDTNSDYHRVSGLQRVDRLYYLLYASGGGAYVDDAATLSIMEAFLELLTTGWLRIAPDAGEVAPGASAALAVTFDASSLDGGQYAATIQIRSNDPLTPLVAVPVELTVTGVPDIAVGGGEQLLESAIDYELPGALTQHALTVVVPPGSDGSIELVADGDYGDSSELATASAEGLALGTVGAVGSDCMAATGQFPIGTADLLALAADGVVRVDVQNTVGVDFFCSTNRHTVRLRYRSAADRLDFGTLFLGLSRTLEIEVRNEGTQQLEISSIASDRPEFVPSVASLSLPPRASAMLAVTFTPGSAQSFDGTLTLLSDDPDEPATVVTLAGIGVEPPRIEVTPPELDAVLAQGVQETQPLTVLNSGGSALEFTAEVVPRGAGLQRTSFTMLSAGDGRSNNPQGSVSGTERVEPPPFRGADASFEALPYSPTALTCIAGDIAGRAVYAQANGGYDFYRFRAETGAWERLASSPIDSGNNGGAAVLGGAVYTSYTDPVTDLGVYDIATDSWTTRPHPLEGATGSIASDGERYLYFARERRLVRYDPTTQEAVDLAVPPFAFAPWGGLAYSKGRLYGHAGDGSTEFAVYDVAGDAWRALPPLPAGAVLGAAIDPMAQEYAATGPYGGTNLYRFSLTDEIWSVSTLPFYVDDGGMTWLPGRPSGLYIVQGERGSAFARLVGAPAWLQVVPDAGTVTAGGTAVLDVTFDSSLLLGGDVGATIEIRSNDPLTPLVAVPADLTVIGVPDIVLHGAKQQLESALDYGVSGARTQHALTIVVPPADGGSIELVADGDYGDSYEQATATAEGLTLGSVGATASDCAPATGLFPIGAADLLALTADGVVRVDVQNSSTVDAICAVNRHTVRLHYRTLADRLDFGELFVGLSRTLDLEVMNGGTSPLEISSISSDLPEFVPSPTSLNVAPRASAILAVTFTPGSTQPFDGVLTIASNDPDEPLKTVLLHGEGLLPPDIAVTPSALAADLITGGVDAQVLTIENVSGSDLVWSAEVEYGESGRVLSSSPIFRGSETVEPAPEQVLPPPPGRPPGEQVYAAGVATSPDSAAEAPEAMPTVPLDAILDYLDARHASITRLIPDRFDFSGGVTGGGIDDGGNDMYDGGNYLSTDIGGYLSYSEGRIAASHLLGASGRYFTRKYPGLFVFAADVAGVQAFSISGTLGAGGRGSVDGAVLEATVQGVTYRGFVKRVFEAGVPSVNHLIVVAHDPAVDHEFSSWTASDYHSVFGMQRVNRFYYLLYASEGGGYIDDATTLSIMTAFLNTLSPPWLSVEPAAGTVPVGDSNAMAVRFDASGLDGGDYAATIRILSNDPDEPAIAVAAALHVTASADIAVAGPEQLVESTRDYSTDGAITQHALPLGVPPLGDGELELVAEGDYGGWTELATATAEGRLLGSVGGIDSDCVPVSGRLPIRAADLLALGADGVVHVDVQNSVDVGAFCSVNRHTVRLHYRGTADSLDFGALYIGLPRTLDLEVRNAGALPLEVSSIATDLPEFVPSPSSLSIAPWETALLRVTFTPSAAEAFAATLTLTSNDPDEPLTTVALHGAGLVPPDISLDPLSLEATLYTGQTAVQTLSIANGGGDALRWTAGIESADVGRVLSASPVFAGVEPPAAPSKEALPPPEGRPPADQLYEAGVAGSAASTDTGSAFVPGSPLEDVLLALDARFGEITGLIPNRFDFSEGVTGTFISDGDNDMYDGGNFLSTDLGGSLTYSDGSIRASGLLGPSGRYFTRKHPGLFVLAADLDGVSEFTISGDLGADGGGSVDGVVLETTVLGTRYRGFVKRVFNAHDPSVNHLVIVPYDPAVDQDFATNTNSDYHRVFGLPGARRIYYLLYASGNGGYVDNDTTLSIMEAFLRLLAPAWIGIEPAAGELAPGSAVESAVTFNATGLGGGDFAATIQILSNDPDEPSIPIPAVLHVTAAPRLDVSPRELDFGALYLGATRTIPVTVRNDGVLPLAVADIAAGDAAFSADPRQFTLQPGEEETVDILFAPTEAREVSTVLSITSNDPVEPVTTVALRGAGLIPPDIQITPSELSEALYSDQIATRTLMIENTGGADLVFRADALSRPGSRAGAKGPVPAAEDDDAPRPRHPSETAGEPVRPLEGADGVAPADLPVRDGFEDGDFTGWEVVPFTGNISEVTDATAAPGGRYSFHHQTVTDAEHMSGIYRNLGPVQPRYVSFWIRSGSSSTNDGYFVLRNSLGGEVIWFFARSSGFFYVNADVGGDESFPYAAQAWYHIEFRNIDFVSKSFDYYVNDQLVKPGIPFRSAGSTTDVARLDLYNWSSGSEAWWDEILIAAEEPPRWLRFEPHEGVIAAGGRLNVVVTFDATGLFGGDYMADLEVASNDPDEPRVVVPIQLHVTGIPRLEVRGSRIDAESTIPFVGIGATTTHLFPMPDIPVVDAELELVAEGDYGTTYERATATAEGRPLGSVGGVGDDCIPAIGSFAIDETLLAELGADGRVDVRITNSSDVDPSCSVNQHTVRLAFFGPADRLDFGPVFLGFSRELQLELVNSGTDLLQISSIVSDRGDVVPLVTALEIPARSFALVPVVYSPTAEGPLQGTLRVASNDPDRPELVLPLAGTGLIPPEIATRPEAVVERLLPGDLATLPLAVDNGGGSELRFDVAIVAPSASAVLPPAPEGAPLRSDTRPASFVEQTASPRTMDGAEVLLVEDVLPWGSSADTQILDANGIPYDVIPSSALAATDLSRYLVLILPSDQPYSYYVNLSGLGQKLDEFVSSGGVLEFHAADAGWYSGDSSLVPVPGGLYAETGYAWVNYVLDGSHPITAGVPSPISAGLVSHAFFTGVPAHALRLVEDLYMRPNLVVYSHGAGLVVASGQTLEYLYSRGNSGGLLLANMIPFCRGAARRWITVDPLSGTVPEGASLDLAVTLDARVLTPGDYTVDLALASNDPTTPRLAVPVHLAVVRLIAQAGPDQVVECDGGGDATVALDGASSRHVDGPDAIVLYQWYEGDTLLGDGASLAVDLPVGTHAITLRITDSQADTSTDELLVTVADTTPPAGRITAPADGQCFGPAALPVIVTDDFADSCTDQVLRSYTRPQGAVYSEHGDWSVGLVASDPYRNAAPEDTVIFTIDTVPPAVDILVVPSRWTFPKFIPFQRFFVSSDDDGATGAVVHETIAVDGCVVYDGLTFGDGDGVLLDEVLPAAEDEMCRLARLCGRRLWNNPVITVAATDCGGNSTTDTMVKPGYYYASPQRCP